jgi:hypothetical protein
MRSVIVLEGVTLISESLFIDPRFSELTAGHKYDARAIEDDSALVRLIKTKYVTNEIMIKEATFFH